MRVAKNVIIANGTLELIEFEHIFDVQLISRHNMATVGGWLVEQIGEVPKNGYSHYTEQFLFHILSSDPRRIQQMYIYRLRSGKGRS